MQKVYRRTVQENKSKQLRDIKTDVVTDISEVRELCFKLTVMNGYVVDYSAAVKQRKMKYSVKCSHARRNLGIKSSDSRRRTEGTLGREGGEVST